MATLRDLVAHVGQERFQDACRWAWNTAAGTGTGGGRSWPDGLDEVPHDLADAIATADGSPAERVELALELYAAMPCYANLMYVQHDVAAMDREQRRAFWTEYGRLLGEQDARLADPVAYSLWCDYFEDPDTVDEAWTELALPDELSEEGLERLLDISGPVPFGLKEPFYDRLLSNKRWHQAIFVGLVRSAFDYYGDLDIAAARRILARLDVPEDATGMEELRARLGG